VKQNYILALISALMLWLAWPPIAFTSPLLFIALVPLLLAVENILQSDYSKKGRKIFWLSFATFFIWNTGSIYWVFNSLHAVMPAGLALLISLIPFGLAPLLMSAAFWLYYRCRLVLPRIWGFWALVCFWIGYEYLHQSWDLAFPWMNLGNGFAETQQLIQWYEFTGVYGGTYWVLMSNILILLCIISFRENQPVKKKRNLIIRASLHILIPIAVSLYMYSSYEEEKNPSNVVVVQPNVDPYSKYGSLSALEQLETLTRLSDSLGQANTEYFIWPETAIPEYTDEERIRGSLLYGRIQNFLNKYKNANLISGMESYLLYDSAKTPTARHIEQLGRYADSFNAAVQIENSAEVQFYHKSKLVPGVEQLPFASALAFMKPLFAAFGGTTGGYGRQDEPSVFYSQSGIGAAPVICYESIWGAYVAEAVKNGAQFIAIITNDGWWGNTSGKDQHMAYAKLRAVETRRWVARSANTGISGFINQRGDVVKQSSWWVPTALKADINLNEKLTFYVKHGDYIAFAGCIGTGAFLILLILRRKKKA